MGDFNVVCPAWINEIFVSYTKVEICIEGVSPGDRTFPSRFQAEPLAISMPLLVFRIWRIRDQ